MKNVNFCDRILQLVDYYGSGKNTIFANKIGVTESNVRSWLNNTLPKVDAIEKIARFCDGVSLDWIVLGEGSMLKSDVSVPMGAQEGESERPSNALETSTSSVILELVEQIKQLTAENALLKAELDRRQIAVQDASTGCSARAV